MTQREGRAPRPPPAVHRDRGGRGSSCARGADMIAPKGGDFGAVFERTPRLWFWAEDHPWPTVVRELQRRRCKGAPGCRHGITRQHPMVYSCPDRADGDFIIGTQVGDNVESCRVLLRVCCCARAIDRILDHAALKRQQGKGVVVTACRHDRGRRAAAALRIGQRRNRLGRQTQINTQQFPAEMLAHQGTKGDELGLVRQLFQLAGWN